VGPLQPAFPIMYTHPRFSQRSRGLRLAGAIFAAAALGWTAAAFATAADPDAKVSVRIDPTPINREADGGLRVSFAPVVKSVAPAVVQVNVTARREIATTAGLPPFLQDPRWRQFFNIPDQDLPRRRLPDSVGTGSGVIVSQDGYILTNNHVVENADQIRVVLNDRRELDAEVVGTDPESDLAVIKIDAKELPAVTFADSDQIEVGDTVLAIGNPFGLGQTVTSGMVSALGRATLGLDYEDFIQTDAAINPGNSGGALVDADGRLVGINTAILSRSGGFQGIGFAIPANLARNVMQQLAEHGRVVRGFLGVSVQDLTPELAAGFDLDDVNAGALISEVTEDSAADKAGLEAGDIVTELNGRPVHSARHLKLAVADIRPGDSVEAEILRDGDRKTIDITVGSRPGEAQLAAADRLEGKTDDTGSLNGVGVTDLNNRSRRQFDLPTGLEGALVTTVDPDSAAARAGLQPGDVIVGLNRRPVRSAEDAIQLTEESTPSKRTLVRVWSARGGIRYLIVDESAAS